MANGMDTLTTDTARIASWMRSGDYAYNEQLLRRNKDWTEEFFQRIRELLPDWDTSLYEWTAQEIASVLIAFFVLLVAVAWVWRNRYRWAGKDEAGKVRVDYAVSEDTIYGIDFDTAIRKAMARECYAEVVRLAYLRALRRLHDAGSIVWQAGRTPETYLNNLPAGPARERLRVLTREYVEVRYGHYAATRQQAEELLRKEGGKE